MIEPEPDTTSRSPELRYSLLRDQDLEQDDEDLLDGSVRIDEVGYTHPRPRQRMGFIGRLRGSQRITFLAVLLLFFVITIWLLTNLNTSPLPEIDRQTAKSSVSINFEAPLRPDGSKKPADIRTDMDGALIYKWYQDNCYQKGDLGRSIPDVYQKLEILRKSIKEKCHLIWQIFDSMLRIEYIPAPISLPGPFQEEVKGWLNNDQALFDQVNKQVVYKITNKGTFEETIFNPIRSKRPQSKATVDPLVYIKNLTESTKAACDFCRYKEHTAEDVFGRIDNQFSASSSNAFKLAKFHGLFFPKQHSPLNLSSEVLEDIFLHTSKQWFEKAFAADTQQIYPSLMWDTFPHAGASQVHPHIHGVLYAHQYVGGFEAWHQVSLRYYDKWKRSFWTDFVQLHFALGLGITSGDAVVIVPLTARKDNEFMIVSPSLNKDVTSVIHRILQTYETKLGVYCFSSAGVYPKMSAADDGDTGMPVIFRFGSRGTCSAIGSDVSSLELYTINNVNSDLAKTFNGLVEQGS